VKLDKIIERINPIENIIERKVDVKIDRVVERVNAIDNPIERQVDVKVDRIVERVNPVVNTVERFVDVPLERIIERVRPVETVVERFVDAFTTKPARAKPDDLKIVEGIGPAIEKLFHAEGIYTFEALATLRPSWIADMLRKAGPRFSVHDPETWPQQSALANAGKMDDLKKLQDRLNAGRR
jgi:predicted flap endonuclease-1-like 5' DNA nuclease